MTSTKGIERIIEALDVAQLDNEQTVVLSVRKQAGKNTVAVVDAVKERLAKAQLSLPPGFHLDVVHDNSQVIRTGTSAVLERRSFFAELIVESDAPESCLLVTEHAIVAESLDSSSEGGFTADTEASFNVTP